jgi:2-oxo-4-hydroxy-4-carboxy-5-ureidoimidazoline decarboxylase
MSFDDVNSLDTAALVQAFGDIAEHTSWVAVVASRARPFPCPDSRKEQAGTGLGTLSAEEMARITDLDTRYREHFGFPFIPAVKGATKHQILDAFSARVSGGREEEFLTALAQVMRIIRFRLEERVDG